MHTNVCILSVRVVQQRHVANTARAVYKQNKNACSNWGQRGPIVRSRHPLHYPAHFFCLRRVHRDCRSVSFGPTFKWRLLELYSDWQSPSAGAMHSCLWQSRVSATSDTNIAKHTHTRKLAARTHIYTYALEQIGDPYLGLGGTCIKMFAYIFIYSYMYICMYTNIFMHVPTPQAQIGFPNLLKCICINMCARSELARMFVLCDMCIRGGGKSELPQVGMHSASRRTLPIAVKLQEPPLKGRPKRNTPYSPDGRVVKHTNFVSGVNKGGAGANNRGSLAPNCYSAVIISWVHEQRPLDKCMYNVYIRLALCLQRAVAARRAR